MHICTHTHTHTNTGLEDPVKGVNIVLNSALGSSE